jgi:hypothetical protein
MRGSELKISKEIEILEPGKLMYLSGSFKFNDPFLPKYC